MSLKRTISGFKTVNEFLEDLAQAVEKAPWPKAIADAMPWAGVLAEGIADTVGPIKFIVKLYEAATRIDNVNDLGEVACTVAFQRCVQQALTSARLLPKSGATKVAKNAANDIRNACKPREYDFTTMRLSEAIQHEFVADAKAWLTRFLDLAGIGENERNKILLDVEHRFGFNIELLVTNRDTASKFEPFYQLLVLDNPAHRAYQALRRHASYQRWVYEERRILREEPYALQHIYVRTDCGDLKWGDFEQRRRERQSGMTYKPTINPFLDHPDHGGRHDLLETVLRHMADPTLRDLIVIQGPPGTGKSSLTLRLCHDLFDYGLIPIRIELKNLDTTANRHIRATLPEAVRLAEEDFDPSLNDFQYRDGLFLEDRIFQESVDFGGMKICRYVLILDAWDEISIAAEEGYQQHVERLLKEIRDTYLSSSRGNPIRVILTGRPTEAVTQGKLMLDDTRLLTLRYFTPDQLVQFQDQLAEAVQFQPLRSPEWVSWTTPTAEVLESVRNKYAKGIAARARAAPRDNDPHLPLEDGLELFGSPLLGLLSLRLLSQWAGDPVALFGSRTVLYRSLVDLLLGGKPPSDEDKRNPPLFTKEALRHLLRRTAEAMTVLGKEGLPKAELLERLQLSASEIDTQIGCLLDDNKLSRLLVSFFFHAGRPEHGCEFSHKSFREYLFAEQVVESLKEYGRNAKRLPMREVYWRDFSDEKEEAPRREFAHRLAKLLGPQWLTREVGNHISDLIEWEVLRSVGEDPFPPVRNGSPTTALPLEQWVMVRNSLADLWDWWGEGVHLRPQPYKTQKSPLEWAEPVAVEVAQMDRLLSGQLSDIRPPRVITVDSHLGDALFQLCCDVHRVLIEHGGEVARSTEPRRYQSRDRVGVRFRPTGGEHYWRNYWHRIEAAGYRWRFRDRFPQGINLSFVDWNAEDLEGMKLEGVNFTGASLIRSDLTGMILSNVNFERAILAGAILVGANLTHANLQGAHLKGTDLRYAQLMKANLAKADLQAARLEKTNFAEANLHGVDFHKADITYEQLRSANGTPRRSKERPDLDE